VFVITASSRLEEWHRRSLSESIRMHLASQSLEQRLLVIAERDQFQAHDSMPRPDAKAAAGLRDSDLDATR